MEPMGDAGTSAGAETAQSCLPWLRVTLRGDLQLEHGHLKARPGDSWSLEVGRAKEKVRSLPRSQHQNHHKTRKDRVECSPNIYPRADAQEVLLVCRSGGRLPEAWGVSTGDAARGRWAGRGCVRGRFYAQLSKAGGGHLPPPGVRSRALSSRSESGFEPELVENNKEARFRGQQAWCQEPPWALRIPKGTHFLFPQDICSSSGGLADSGAGGGGSGQAGPTLWLLQEKEWPCNPRLRTRQDVGSLDSRADFVRPRCARLRHMRAMALAPCLVAPCMLCCTPSADWK